MVESISGRSSIHFGIHSANKTFQKTRRQNKYFNIIAAGAIIVLGFVMICLIVLDLCNNANEVSTSKRNISSRIPEHFEELMKLQQPLVSSQNVDLEPESTTSTLDNSSDEQTSTETSFSNVLDNEMDDRKYSNHRYTTNEENVDRIGIKPRPFSKELNRINSIQDILGHETVPPFIPKPRSRAMSTFSSPMRFRGFYLQKQDGDANESIEDFDRSEEYFKKINSYFAAGKDGYNSPKFYQDRDAGDAINAKHLVSAGSDRYTEAIFHPLNMSEPTKDIKKNWSRRKHKGQRKPFTVMLDIYPMENTGEESREGFYHNRIPQRPINDFPIQMRPGEQFLQPEQYASRPVPQFALPVPQFALPVPQQKRKEKKRMLMKLNLFPRQPDHRQRRTWNLFPKQEEREFDGGCEIIGHNKKGKPISAKWKDKNGDLIHAKVVTMHQLDDRSDSHINPR